MRCRSASSQHECSHILAEIMLWCSHKGFI
jgi:hypothetical protein